MDDFPEKEPPRFWIAFTILCTALALCFGMVVYTSTKVHAQDRAICAPSASLQQYGSALKEKVIWEGTMPTEQGPPLQFVLLQSDKGKWSLFVIQQGIACLRAAGDSATQIEMGKGI